MFYVCWIFEWGVRYVKNIQHNHDMSNLKAKNMFTTDALLYALTYRCCSDLVHATISHKWILSR